MYKISSQIAQAFENGKTLTLSNTKTDGTSIFLFNNEIATREDNETFISLAGWNTKTTRERLNALPNCHITTKKGQAFLKGQPIEDNQWYKLS